jgi:hypothetical protein
MAQAHQGDRQVYGHLPKGCTPPDSVTWANRDNNQAFLAQSVAMTLNTMLSIPNMLRVTRPEDYHVSGRDHRLARRRVRPAARHPGWCQSIAPRSASGYRPPVEANEASAIPGRLEAGAGTFGHEALGGISSPAGSCVWHVVGLQRSVREWAIRRSWNGRPVRQEQAQGILVAALGVLAMHFGSGEAKRAPVSLG